MELTLDLSSFTLSQRQELLALIESFSGPRYTQTSDEKSAYHRLVCAAGCVCALCT